MEQLQPQVKSSPGIQRRGQGDHPPELTPRCLHGPPSPTNGQSMLGKQSSLTHRTQMRAGQEVQLQARRAQCSFKANCWVPQP